MQTRHSFKYWQWRVIICSMIGYSMFYFVRKNFAFAMPALNREFGITNTDFGIILTLVGIVYGVSKFVNGIIADRTNARWHLVVGLGVCVLLNFIFGWSDVISNAIIDWGGGRKPGFYRHNGLGYGHTADFQQYFPRLWLCSLQPSSRTLGPVE